MARDVIVITGVGGIGSACARRIGSGFRLLVGDFAVDKMEAGAGALAREGHEVVARQVDVSDRQSVEDFARVANEMGRLRTIVHTAGVSPMMASSENIIRVDLLGTEHVLDAFQPMVSENAVCVCLASMAAYVAGLDASVERAIATCPAEELLDAIGVPLDTLSPQVAYCIAKRGVHLRVEHAATAWGRRGARVVSISPAIALTAMGRIETEAQPQIEKAMMAAPIPRFATADEIAGAIEWLASPSASFVTGCDLRIDGGAIAAINGGAPSGLAS